jgi:hypothetical protein
MSRDRFVLACQAGIVVALLTAILSTSGGGYLTTDDWFLVSSGRAEGFASLWERQTAGPPAIRPVSIGLSRLQHRLLGDEPGPRRMLWIAMHGLISCLAAALLLGMGQAPRIAWLTGALFAAWPLAAEPLAWFHAGHTSLPLAALCLGALAAHAHRRPPWLSVGLLVAALLTRENAVMVVPIAGLISLRRSRSWRASLPEVLPLIVPTAVYVAVRGWQIIGALSGDASAYLPVSPDPLLATGHVLAHLLAPVHPGVAGAPWLAVGSAALLGLSVFRGRKGAWSPAIWVVLWALPFLPLYATDDAIFSAAAGFERRWYHVYLPSLGLVWLVARGVYQRPALAVVAFVAALGLQTVNARWWADLGTETRASAVALGELAEGGALIVAIEQPYDAVAEVVEHQVLDLDRIHPREDPAPVYRKIPGDPRLFRATPDEFGYPHWVEVPRPDLVEAAVRVVWRVGERRFERVGVLP